MIKGKIFINLTANVSYRFNITDMFTILTKRVIDYVITLLDPLALLLHA